MLLLTYLLTYLLKPPMWAVGYSVPRAMYCTQGRFLFSVTNTSPSDVVTIRMWSAAGSGLGIMNTMFLRAALTDQKQTLDNAW